MKRLSMLAALAVVAVAGALGSSAQAQMLDGNVAFHEYDTPRDIPAGTAETGRYARFIEDTRMSDLNLKNTDFENWKPLDVMSHEMTRHFLFGRLQTRLDSHIPDQEIGRYVRVIEDDRLVANNMEFDDRTFYGYQAPSPYTANSRHATVRGGLIRGLQANTNLGWVMPRHAELSGAPHVLYFWQ
jgi:hypothetical protein